jgi:hypothetical protein
VTRRAAPADEIGFHPILSCSHGGATLHLRRRPTTEDARVGKRLPDRFDRRFSLSPEPIGN